MPPNRGVLHINDKLWSFPPELKILYEPFGCADLLSPQRAYILDPSKYGLSTLSPQPAQTSAPFI